MCKKTSIKGKLLISTLVAIPVLFVLFFIVTLLEKTLEVKSENNTVKIQTLWLGEYHTNVEKLVIYEEKENKKVVIFKSKNESSRMHTVTVRSGINAFDDMYLDRYEINYSKSGVYKFKNNITYKVVAKWPYYSKETTFILLNNT